MNLPCAPEFGPRPSLFRRALSSVAVGAPITRTLLIVVGAALLIFAAGFAVQTVRLDGLRVQLPFVGSFGPHGWKPYALAMKKVAVRVTLERDQSEANHRQTKANYAAAAAQAQENHNAEINRIQENHSRVVEGLRSSLESARAAARARAAELRRQAVQSGSTADRASGRVQDAGPPGSEFAYEPTGCYGVPGQRSAIEQIDCAHAAQNVVDQLIALQSLIRSFPGFREVSEAGFEQLRKRE